MNLETNEIFGQLLDIPDHCIYGLVNDTDLRYQVFYTKSFCTHILGVIKNLKQGSIEYGLMGEDTKKIRLVLLHDCTLEDKDYRVIVSKYRNFYKVLGYDEYKATKDPKYKLKIEVMGSLLQYTYGVFLKGYNTNILLKELDTYKDAIEYVSSYRF